MSSQRPPPMMLAPGASSGAAYAPGRDDPPPPIDARLARPEGHEEVVNGVAYRTMGANPPHATQHLEVAHVFRGCLAPGFAAAVDMLTRSKKNTDAAPDVSIFPEGPDPQTGGRKLEEIAFEVCDTERVEHLTEKVRALALRGVRRLFYIRVADRTVFEWQHPTATWLRLGDDAVLEDSCFLVPIPVRALIDRVLADDTVARALLASGNRVLGAALTEQREAGAQFALAESVLAVLDARGWVVEEALRDRVMACGDRGMLAAWHRRAVTAATVAEVFRDPEA